MIKTIVQPRPVQEYLAAPAPAAAMGLELSMDMPSLDMPAMPGAAAPGSDAGSLGVEVGAAAMLQVSVLSENNR